MACNVLLQRSTDGDGCPPMRRALVTTDDDQQVRVHGPLKRLQVITWLWGPCVSQRQSPRRLPFITASISCMFMSAQSSWSPAWLASLLGSMCACPLSPSPGEMAVNRKMAVFRNDTNQNLEAAGRPVQLEITPVHTGSSRFDVLALSQRPCHGGLSVTAVTEVSGPQTPRCSHSHRSEWGSSACFRASSI